MKEYKLAEEKLLALTQNPNAKNDMYGFLGLAIINVANVPKQRRKVGPGRGRGVCVLSVVACILL
jgi:hypothetical protein